MDMQSRNLTIPRGKIFFAKYKTGTQVPGPFREFGNCPEFTLSRESNTLPHYSSQHGARVLDDEFVIEATLNGSVVTDDIRSENVAYWFMGDVTTLTTTALTGETETFAAVAAGDVFQLGRSDTVPSGFRKVSNVVVKDDATPTPATLTLNDDYTVDLDLGILEIVPGSAAIGSAITVTYDVAASSREQIIAGETQIEGELKFVSFNPKGVQADITIPRARISPNGDFQMLNDPDSTAYQTMPLSISVLKKGNLALAYRDGRVIAA